MAEPRQLTPARRARYLFEYALLRLALGVVVRIPPALSLRTAAALGALVYRLIPLRRRVAVDNVLRSGLAADAAAARRIARASFAHLGTTAVETLLFRRLLRDDRWRSHVTIDAPPQLEADVARTDRGVILAAGHYGNWEIGARLFAQWRPLLGIARALDNPYANRLLTDARADARFQLVSKRALQSQTFIHALRDNTAVAIMIDQHGGRGGMVLPFLGRPASTHTSVARLAQLTGAPVYFGYARRVAPLRFECRLKGPFFCERTADRDEGIRRFMLQLHAALEEAIRGDPTQYMWAHRRWRPQDAARATAP